MWDGRWRLTVVSPRSARRRKDRATAAIASRVSAGRVYKLRLHDQPPQQPGIARLMCAHSLECARSRGYRAIRFDLVVSTNDRAIHLWQSLGFEVVWGGCHWRSNIPFTVT